MSAPPNEKAFDAVRARTKHALPMWVDSFLRDTMHLTAEHIGAYTLILYAMWGRPSCDLPDDDAQLAAVCRTTKIIWLRKLKPVIWPLLKVSGGVVFSSRLQKEAVFCEKYLRSQSEKKRGKLHDKPLNYNEATQSGDWSGDVSPEDPTQQPNNPTQDKEAAAERARPENCDLVQALIHALGFDRGQTIPTYWATPDASLIVARWQTDLHLTRDEILHVAQQNSVQKGSPANGPKTLNRPMQDYAAAKSAPPLTPTPQAPATGARNGRSPSPAVAFGQSVHRLADDLSAGRVTLETASRDPFAARPRRDTQAG